MYEQYDVKPIAEQIASSRVDMLIAIYDATIEATDKAANMLRANKAHEAALAKSQALVLVHLIESGLDLSQGEIPKQIKELCAFIEHSLLHSNPEAIAASTRVLINLRDGFAGIKREAIAMETNGEIPRLATVSVDTVV